MDRKYYQVQENLEKESIPEYPSFVPNDMRNSGGYKDIHDIYSHVLAEVSANNELLPLLSGFTSFPSEVNLSEVERELKRYPAIKEDFFCVNEAKENRVEDLGAETLGFKTASGANCKKENAARREDTLKKESAAKKECNVDEYIVERIKNEILDKTGDIKWDDIVGLDNVKKTINEIVLWPMQRPDIFKGLRGPPKGLLLFGPPGTGKTMIGKCIASQCKATFFSISASSLTSKWVGEGEKMVRALFYLAREMQPSVVFIDEIDSLLSQRTDNENEGSRRIKTEFLVQFDGAATSDEDRILVIGATNRPQEIDEAARRRLVKRIYVALPEKEARKLMISQLIAEYKNNLDESELQEISEITSGYSGSDIFNLCREASLEPLREIDNINNFTADQTRPICAGDFRKAMCQIRRSVSQDDLTGYSEWNQKFGSMA